MTKGKKIAVSIIAFLVLLAGTCYGLIIYSKAMPDTSDGISYLDSEKKEEGTKYPVLEEDTYFGNAGYASTEDAHGYYLPALEKANSKYIWINTNGDIYGVSKKKLQANMMDAADRYSVNECLTDINTITELAENMTHNFTSGYNRSFYKGSAAFWKFGNWGDKFEAFGTDILPADEFFSDQNHNNNPLKERGLKLKIKNVEIEKVLCSESYTTERIIILQVGADVKCQEKSEIFEQLSWIPNKGETSHITFTYYAGIDNLLSGGIYPRNIIAVQS